MFALNTAEELPVNVCSSPVKASLVLSRAARSQATVTTSAQLTSLLTPRVSVLSRCASDLKCEESFQANRV